MGLNHVANICNQYDKNGKMLPVLNLLNAHEMEHIKPKSDLVQVSHS